MSLAKFKLADWTRGNQKSVLEKMLTGLEDPEMISFALGLPAAELFPAAEFSDCLARVLSRNKLSLQYRPPLARLKKHIVELMRLRGVETTEECIFLTSGAQQGVNLLAHLLLNFGGEVILEEKTYTGFQQVLKPFAPRISVIPSNTADGFDVEALARLLENGVRPAFFYTVCDGHNPLSINLDPAKRHRLLELAQAYGFPIIEDDPYGFLSYDDAPPAPPLIALDPEHVLYVGTFSKILAPGLRTGWLIVPPALVGQLGSLKEAADINTAPLNQHLIAEFFDHGFFLPHLTKLKDEYGRRRDAMRGALGDVFQGCARWNSPSNGLFLWLEFEPRIETEKLLEMSLRTTKVAFIPGHMFNVSESRAGEWAVRLNFTNNDAETNREGVRRLAAAHAMLGR